MLPIRARKHRGSTIAGSTASPPTDQPPLEPSGVRAGGPGTAGRRRGLPTAWFPTASPRRDAGPPLRSLARPRSPLPQPAPQSVPPRDDPSGPHRSFPARRPAARSRRPQMSFQCRWATQASEPGGQQTAETGTGRRPADTRAAGGCLVWATRAAGTRSSSDTRPMSGWLGQQCTEVSMRQRLDCRCGVASPRTGPPGSSHPWWGWTRRRPPASTQPPASRQDLKPRAGGGPCQRTECRYSMGQRRTRQHADHAAESQERSERDGRLAPRWRPHGPAAAPASAPTMNPPIRRGSHGHRAPQEQPQHAGQLHVAHAHPSGIGKGEHEQEASGCGARDQLLGHPGRAGGQADDEGGYRCWTHDPVGDDPVFQDRSARLAPARRARTSPAPRREPSA